MNRSYVKVGVAGTHSTGKSSLLDALHETFAGEGVRVQRVSGLALQAQAAGFPILHMQTEETALWIMAEGLKQEAQASLEADLILVDRPLFDALGYLEAALEVTGRERASVRHSVLEALALGFAPDYDVLVVTELDTSVPLGEGRDTDASFREAAGRRIAAIAERFAVAPLKMNPANAIEIEEQLTGFIRDRLNSVST